MRLRRGQRKPRIHVQERPQVEGNIYQSLLKKYIYMISTVYLYSSQLRKKLYDSLDKSEIVLHKCT